MRTKNEPDRIMPLPPPPAPPARDANPWPVSAQHPAAKRAASPARTVRQRREPRPAGSALRSLAAIGVAVIVLTAALIRASESGRLTDLVGPGIALLVVLMLVVSRLRRARRRSGQQSPGAPAG